MAWIGYKPKAKMLVLDKIYGEDMPIPDYFAGENIVHLPDGQVPHLHDDDRGDEERLRRSAEP